MKRYLLVDNDNTLMDFNLGERLALAETLRSCGLPDTPDVLAAYHDINEGLWKALERGETTLARLKVERFAKLLEALHREDMDAAATADAYENKLGDHAEPLPGAEHLLAALHGRMKIALVSNGISRIQRSRLSHSTFLPYLDAIIISEEIGVKKPDPAMVEAALTALGCEDKAEAIFLGDSLTADIAAANAAGIESIWLAPAGESDRPTYTVRTLAEAEELLLSLTC